MDKITILHKKRPPISSKEGVTLIFTLSRTDRDKTNYSTMTLFMNNLLLLFTHPHSFSL